MDPYTFLTLRPIGSHELITEAPPTVGYGFSQKA